MDIIQYLQWKSNSQAFFHLLPIQEEMFLLSTFLVTIFG